MTCYTITIFPEQGKPGKSTGRKYKTVAGANRRARELSMTAAGVMVWRENRDDDHPDTINSSTPLFEWAHGVLVRARFAKCFNVDEAKKYRDRRLRSYDWARKARVHAERYAQEHGTYALNGDTLDEMRKHEEAVRLKYLEARDMFNAVVSA